MISIHDNIVLVPIADVEHSCITFFIDAGANRESGKKVGIAHFLEHTLVAQAKFGITFEAETQLEYVLFQSTQCPNDTTKNLKKFKKLLFEDSIKKESFQVQQKRIQLELLASSQHMFQDVYAELFGKDSGQYRGWSGSVDGVTSITFDDIREHRKNFFHVDNLVIVVSGNFDKGEVLHEIANLKLQKSMKSVVRAHTLRNKII